MHFQPRSYRHFIVVAVCLLPALQSATAQPNQNPNTERLRQIQRQYQKLVQDLNTEDAEIQQHRAEYGQESIDAIKETIKDLIGLIKRTPPFEDPGESLIHYVEFLMKARELVDTAFRTLDRIADSNTSLAEKDLRLQKLNHDWVNANSAVRALADIMRAVRNPVVRLSELPYPDEPNPPVDGPAPIPARLGVNGSAGGAIDSTAQNQLDPLITLTSWPENPSGNQPQSTSPNPPNTAPPSSASTPSVGPPGNTGQEGNPGGVSAQGANEPTQMDTGSPTALTDNPPPATAANGPGPVTNNPAPESGDILTRALNDIPIDNATKMQEIPASQCGELPFCNGTQPSQQGTSGPSQAAPTGNPVSSLINSANQPGSMLSASETGSTDTMGQYTLALNQLAVSLNQLAQNSERYPASIPASGAPPISVPLPNATSFSNALPTTASGGGTAASNAAPSIQACANALVACLKACPTVSVEDWNWAQVDAAVACVNMCQANDLRCAQNIPSASSSRALPAATGNTINASTGHSRPSGPSPGATKTGSRGRVAAVRGPSATGSSADAAQTQIGVRGALKPQQAPKPLTGGSSSGTIPSKSGRSGSVVSSTNCCAPATNKSVHLASSSTVGARTSIIQPTTSSPPVPVGRVPLGAHTPSPALPMETPYSNVQLTPRTEMPHLQPLPKMQNVPMMVQPIQAQPVPMRPIPPLPMVKIELVPIEKPVGVPSEPTFSSAPKPSSASVPPAHKAPPPVHHK
jgi:hypothetical protein